VAVQHWDIQGTPTEELKRKLATRKFFQGYFRGGKSAAFWKEAIREIEDELRKRGALE